MKEYGRVYAKIDLGAVRFNMDSMLRKISGQTSIMAVVKTDGYGHGAAEIAGEIQGCGRLFGFAVATAEEAFSLRRHGITKPILILGYAFPEDYEEMLRQQIRPAVYSRAMAEELSRTAERLGETAKIHVKIDTGMSRIGYQATEDAADEIAEIAALPGIEIEGIFTHFARADEADKEPTYGQIRQFRGFIAMLAERGVHIPVRHCSNSAGIAEIPQADMDMVRAGITLYGLWPSSEVSRDSLDLRPVMELKSRIVHVKLLEAGRTVSYGGTYRLAEPRRVATIPVGYGDGYPRSLSNKGYILICGKRAPILGRICMDQFMVDVTDIPEACVHCPVTLLGEDGGAQITMEELGELSGRFNYEFACCIGKRVPRVFCRGGEAVSARDCFSE